MLLTKALARVVRPVPEGANRAVYVFYLGTTIHRRALPAIPHGHEGFISGTRHHAYGAAATWDDNGVNRLILLDYKTVSA